MNNVLDNIEIYHNLLDQHEIEYIENELLISKKWSFQRSTDHNEFSEYSFLHQDLNDNEFITEKIFERVKNRIGENFKIDRVYANGQHFGMPGRPHSDHLDKDRYTLLIYVNSCWDMLWCGQTIFFNRYAELPKDKASRREDIIVLSNDTKVVYPVPGSAVFFPSNIIHYAESPSKDCFKFRFTVAYKLRKL